MMMGYVVELVIWQWGYYPKIGYVVELLTQE